MSSKNDMTTDRFADILAAYGGSSARWPEAERASAEQLLSQSGAARDMQAGEDALDSILDLMPQPAPASDRLHSQILDIAFTRDGAAAYNRAAASGEGFLGRLKAVWQTSGALRPAGAALAASLMLGVVFGGMVGPASAEPEQLDLVELALLNNTFNGY